MVVGPAQSLAIIQCKMNGGPTGKELRNGLEDLWCSCGRAHGLSLDTSNIAKGAGGSKG